MKGRCMKQIPLLVTAAIVALSVGGGVTFSARGADDESTPIFGIKIPPGYRDWRLISVAHEEGNLNDLRAILGNDVAIKAAREGTLPYPDGTIIARLAWSYDPLAGEREGLWPSPILRGRATQERGSVHGQGLDEIRLDRRLGVCSLRRRQTRQRGRAQHLLRLPRNGQGARLCLQPLCALKAEREP